MSTTENETRIALVRRKQKRAQRWFRFFLLLMPLGFGIPLALAFTLPEGPWLKYLGMTALGLPILGLAGTLLMLGDRSRYRRSLMVAQAGQELGLEFYEKAPKEIQAWLDCLKTYEYAKHPPTVTNVLTGKLKGEQILIADSVCNFGGGAQSIFEQTLFALLRGKLKGPNFWVRPRNLLEKLPGFLGKKGLQVPLEPEFNEQFILEGDFPKTVRECFSEEVVELCLEQPERSLEVLDGRLVVQRMGNKVNPEDYPPVLADLQSLARALRESSR